MTMWEQEPQSGTRMGTKWEQEHQSRTRMGTKWEQSRTKTTMWDKNGSKNPKIGQEWEQSRNKVETRPPKWDKNRNKVGTRMGTYSTLHTARMSFRNTCPTKSVIVPLHDLIKNLKNDFASSRKRECKNPTRSIDINGRKQNSWITQRIVFHRGTCQHLPLLGLEGVAVCLKDRCKRKKDERVGRTK